MSHPNSSRKKSLFLVALLISGLHPIFAATQTLTILGGKGAQGSIDPYAEASRDNGVTWQPAYLTGWHPWGFIEGTDSWINYDPSPFVGLNTTTLYRIRFSAPDSWTGTPLMNIRISADNLATVRFNDVYIGEIESVGQLNANSLFAANLRPGVNTIMLSLTDWGGWVGFNYRIDLTLEAETAFVLGEAGDSDVDGLTDTEETTIGTDPNVADSDGDGIKDGEEVEKYGTNPLNGDSDGDGVADGEEVAKGTVPALDADGDGLTNTAEATLGTNPNLADTDNDGLTDGVEVDRGLNPLSADTDNDGLADGVEVDRGLDPLSADTDKDGLTDGVEVNLGTNPKVADTDNDGLTDGVEVNLGTNPKGSDTDYDGLTDGVEVDRGLNPLSPDTDGDGVSDLNDKQNAPISGNIIVFGIDSGVRNRADRDGIEIGSQIAAEFLAAQRTAKSQGAFMTSIIKFLDTYVTRKLLTTQEKAALQTTAVRAKVPLPTKG